MLRSAVASSFSVLVALGTLSASLVACSTDVLVTGSGTDPSTEPTPSGKPTTDPGTIPTSPPGVTPPVKVNRAWTNIALPATGLSVASVAGSASDNVWIVASAQGAGQRDPWTVYRFDGAKWTSFPLTATVGRPSFGVAVMGPQKVFLGFSYSADIFELDGGDFTKKAASFSVTSGYSMSRVGDQVFVGTQENFGSGPLYRYDGAKFGQVAVTQGSGGVFSVWGASTDDVWISRSGGLGHLVAGKYEDGVLPAVGEVHGSAKDDVWAIGKDVGVQHYDGSKWSSVEFAGDKTKLVSVHAFAKDDVVVVADKVYRYDGKSFTVDTRANAPKVASKHTSVGSDEAWYLADGQLVRLAPEGK